jgi:hypothetical protein
MSPEGGGLGEHLRGMISGCQSGCWSKFTYSSTVYSSRRLSSSIST